MAEEKNIDQELEAGPRAMKLKSFFANTIEEAIRLARHELGPDAMLVNSRRASVEARAPWLL